MDFISFRFVLTGEPVDISLAALRAFLIKIIFSDNTKSIGGGDFQAKLLQRIDCTKKVEDHWCTVSVT